MFNIVLSALLALLWYFFAQKSWARLRTAYKFRIGRYRNSVWDIMKKYPIDTLVIIIGALYIIDILLTLLFHIYMWIAVL